MSPATEARFHRIRAAILCTALCAVQFVRSQSQLQVGFAILAPDAGAPTPVASALFTYSDANGVIVSQAGVGAVEPILSGRIFVDEADSFTGLALANPSAQTASVALVLRDSSGREMNRDTLSLSAGQHTARYVSQLFPAIAAGFAGSLTFDSNQKLGAITLRESRNARGDPLYSTLPVVNLASPPGSDAIVFPQVAAGGGYSTQVILVNPTGSIIRGKVSFTGSSGSVLVLDTSSGPAAEIPYEIAPHGTFRTSVDRAAGLAAGYAVVTPDPGFSSPSGTAVFRFRQGNALVSEAGVSASRSTTRIRLFADDVNSYTGIALVNRENQEAALTFNLLDTAGNPLAAATRKLPPRGHLAIFAYELFPDLLKGNFLGLLEVSCTASVSPVALKLTINSRNDLILTTLPIADLDHPSSSSSLLIPQVAMGGGFSTQLVFINTSSSAKTSAKLSFFRSDGRAMAVPIAGETQSEFALSLPKSGGRQLLPGNTAGVSAITILDPYSGSATREVTVNEGNILRPRIFVVDTAGANRDDFRLTFKSIDPGIATVDEYGNITAVKAGFSTLTVQSGPVVLTGTITVVKVDSGAPGYQITGIAQDPAHRLYLANTDGHTVLLMPDLKQTPSIYAGVNRTAGLKNDLRLQSLFKNPAYLAVNQGDGTIYVSDGANHVIRRIQPGPQGKVDTFAGTGTAGSSDGPAREASFNNPQGITFDGRGNLWVVDSGNHTIRRISLTAGTVETMAGKAGALGLADGKKETARFRSPAGIALETEPLAKQLERESKGEPPPPVSLIVADTGNSALRRIYSDGTVGPVTTVSSPFTKTAAPETTKASVQAFSAPAAVAVDALGNIYVTETAGRRVRVLLQDGTLSAAAQEGTFSAPRGVLVAASGTVLVADGSAIAQRVDYGGPEINSFSPASVSVRGGARVTVTGRNFASDTVVVAGGVIVSPSIQNTNSLSFTAPPLRSGLHTLTVQNRGGIAQKALPVDAIPLSELPVGYITTIAGGSTFVGDGGPATSAILIHPEGTAIDALGNLYIADGSNNRIRKVDAATRLITSIAGTGVAGASGLGGPAVAAQLSYPRSIAIDSNGNIYVGDSGRIVKISASNGVLTSLAMVTTPSDMAIDPDGNLVVADEVNHRIVRINPLSGVYVVIAGTGTAGYSGDGGPALQAALKYPKGLAIDGSGNIFIADSGNLRIRKVAPSGIITTVAGSGRKDRVTDGAADAVSFHSVWDVAIAKDGGLLIVDSDGFSVARLDQETRYVSVLISQQTFFYCPLSRPTVITIDAAGQFYISDGYGLRLSGGGTVPNVVIKVDPSQFGPCCPRPITGFTIVAGGASTNIGDGGRAFHAQLLSPREIGMSTQGDLLIAESMLSRIRKVQRESNIITTLAGNTVVPYSGQGSDTDGAAATDSSLSLPAGVAADSKGNIYIADSAISRIRKVDSSGRIFTFAGKSGLPWLGSFSGDAGPAITAGLNAPLGLSCDSSDNLFIADYGNNRIRRIDFTSGIITTVAGSGSTELPDGSIGDNGPATAAALSRAAGVTVDNLGRIYIPEYGHQRIRRVDAAGTITTIAGNGRQGSSGDGGAAVAASINLGYMWISMSVSIDGSGNIYFADTGNHRIRRIDGRSGIITTIAGTGSDGFGGDGGAAKSAMLSNPTSLVMDSAGNLFISDSFNNRIRVIRGPIP